MSPFQEQRKYLNDICFERIDEFEVPLLKIKNEKIQFIII